MQLGFLFLGGAALVTASPLGLAMAQVNSETLTTGPRRTDCYIGVSHINRQNLRSPPALCSSKPRPQFIAR
jgi:hypothetical protein